MDGVVVRTLNSSGHAAMPCWGRIAWNLWVLFWMLWNAIMVLRSWGESCLFCVSSLDSTAPVPLLWILVSMVSPLSGVYGTHFAGYPEETGFYLITLWISGWFPSQSVNSLGRGHGLSFYRVLHLCLGTVWAHGDFSKGFLLSCLFDWGLGAKIL